MSHILLLEDDASLGRTLAERLRKDGHDVACARTVKAALGLIGERRWALAVLDVMLPDGSGLDVARAFRRQTTTPVMLMTALHSASTRLEGFETGADEYLPKPFHLREFLLRVRHVLSTRRQTEVIRVHGRVIDLTALTIDGPSGDRVFLQARDGDVLRLLLRAAPSPVDRADILDQVWGRAHFPTTRAVDNSIVRLRHALEDERAELIRSVRGVGYQWNGTTP